MSYPVEKPDASFSHVKTDMLFVCCMFAIVH